MWTMETRTCIRCLKLKELEHGFYFIARSQSYETRCKHCMREYMRSRNKRDGGAAVRNAYLKRKSAGKITSLRYGDKTPEQKRALVDAVKRWRAKNTERFKSESKDGINMRRSAAYRKAWPLIVAHYGGKCLNCGGNAACFDHVIPLSEGGPNALTNGQPLCRACNTFKGHTNPRKDYRPDGGGWVRALVELNPWLAVITSGHPVGWHKGNEGVEFWRKMHEMARGEMRMPELGSRTVYSDVYSCPAPPNDASVPSIAADIASIISALHEKVPTSLCCE